jgi:hypothetical protein
MAEVKVKDRKEEIEYMRMALNICEIGVNYQQSDLIIRVSERLKYRKGKFTIHEGVEIYHKWKQDWIDYTNAAPTQPKPQSPPH